DAARSVGSKDSYFSALSSNQARTRPRKSSSSLRSSSSPALRTPNPFLPPLSPSIFDGLESAHFAEHQIVGTLESSTFPGSEALHGPRPAEGRGDLVNAI